MRNRIFLIIIFCVGLIGCSANVNVTYGDINVMQGDTSISNESGYFNFGNIPLNFSQSITFTIENTGEGDLTLLGYPLITLSGLNAEDFNVSTLSTSNLIRPGMYTSFVVNFEPTSIGSKTAKLRILNNDKDESPYTFVVIGNCTQPAPEIHLKNGDTDIMSTSGTFDFGIVDVDSSSDYATFTIENNGNEVLTLTGNPDKIAISGDDASMFYINQIMTWTNIQSSTSTVFKIKFQPTSAGIKSAKISILNNDSDENPYTFKIFGIGRAIPKIHVYHSTGVVQNGNWKYDFGNVNKDETSDESIFTIENVGTATLHLSNSTNLVALIGADSAMFTLNLTSTLEYIPPGDSTTFGISFTPTHVGLKTITISIENNDENENPFKFTLSGTCLEPEMIVIQNHVIIHHQTGVFDFDPVFTGYSSQDMVFTIENYNTGELKLTGSPKIEISGTDSAMFTIDETMTTTPIAHNSSTSFKIKFTPASAGLKTATISIPNNDFDRNPYTFTIRGLGVIPEPEINVKQNNTNIPCTTGSFDFNGVVVGYPGRKYTFTIESTGNFQLDLMGNPKINVIGADSAMFTVNESMTTTPVYKNNTTTFELTFTPTSLGNKTATVSIPNSDNDENPYTFTVYGTGTPIGSGDPIGWIGDGSNGWKITDAPTSSVNDYRSFLSPQDVFVASDGYIYVVDKGRSRICKWDKNGNAIGWIGGGFDGWQTGNTSYNGTEYKKFMSPSGVFVDDAGYIYVADKSNNRISKWDKNGIAIGWIGGGKDGWQTGNAPNGEDDYKSLKRPESVYVTSYGTIFVSDTSNHRISRWDASGNAGGCIGGGNNGWQTINATSNSGTDYKSFYSPAGITVSGGHIYVADNSNRRVSAWSTGGYASGWIGGGYDGWQTGNAPSQGYGYKEFRSPNDVYCDSNGNIFVADAGNYRISKWNSNGNAIGWIGNGSIGWDTRIGTALGRDVHSFNMPLAVHVDTNGNIYVPDHYNYRVCKWKD